MKIWLPLVLLLFWAIQSQAEPICSALFLDSTTPITLEYSQKRPLEFTKTEVFRRNNDIGQQQVGTLHIKKWFELPPYDQGYYNFVGIADDGKLYHVIDWEGKRRLARLLGGQRQFQDLALMNGELLVAVDLQGKIFVYSPDRWAKSPRNKIITQTFLISGGLFSAMAASFYVTTPEAFDSSLGPMILGASAVVSFLQTGFWGLFRYERLNTYPDGFIKTAWHIEHVTDLEDYAEEIFDIFYKQILTQNSLATDMTPVPLDSLPLPLEEEATETIR